MTPFAAPKLPAYSALATLGFIAALALSRPEPVLLAAPFLAALAVGLALARHPVFSIATSVDRERVVEREEVMVTLALEAATPVERLELLPVMPPGLVLARGWQVTAQNEDGRPEGIGSTGANSPA